MTIREKTQAGFTELHVDQGQGKLYVRDYPGEGPAFLLLHGFPDNLNIYDELAALLPLRDDV